MTPFAQLTPLTQFASSTQPVECFPAALLASVPLQTVDSTAEVAFVGALALAFLASLLLALFVGVRVLRGYRRSGDRRLLLFGVGVLCIVFLSKVTNVALASTLGTSFAYTESVATSWRVVGASLILYAIYEGADRP